MSSRMKDRGGGGGKVMASKPQKALAEATPKDKGGARRTPIAGKENSKTLSGGKVVPTMRQKPATAEKMEKPAVTAGVRWSTSSMPRGKASNRSDFTRLLSHLRGTGGDGNRLSRVSVSVPDGVGKALGRGLEGEAGEKKSLSGIRVLERCQQLKKAGVSKSGVNGKDERSRNGLRVSENGKPSAFLGLHLLRSDSRASGVSSERKGEKALKSSVGLEDCSGRANLDSNPKRTGEKGMEGARARGNHTGKTNFLGTESSKKGSDDDSVVEVCKDDAYLCLDPKSTTGQDSDGIRILENFKDRDRVGLNSKFTNEVALNSVDVLINDKDKDHLFLNLEGTCKKSAGEIKMLDSSIDKIHIHNVSNSKGEGGGKALDGITVSENLNEQRSDEGKGIPVINRYSSKLHEKLAFLEGKVQRIASDIQRTKEMLELNNPDASKLIFSDIQSKISGIEKAIGHVIDGTKAESSLSEPVKDNSLQPKYIEKGLLQEVSGSKNTVKGLNHEELEARFFPHHKLLRSRTSSNSSGGQDKNCGPMSTKCDCDPVIEDRALSPIDENPIALEFLASLSADQSKVDVVDRSVLLEHAAIQEMGSDSTTSLAAQCVSKDLIRGHHNEDVTLTTNEKLEEFGDQENKPAEMLREETEDFPLDQLFEIGRKSSTGGWFVSEGEAVLLAHNDGSCSYYDIVNSEEKTEYSPPLGVSHNLWGDCWIIRAPGADGCSGKYVVAASAGDTLDSGFCSWDFYTKDIRAFRVEDGKHTSFSSTSSLSRSVLTPLPNMSLHRRSSLCTLPTSRSQQWWYRPCGPLLVSTSSRQSVVSAYDIRDGDLVMAWEVQSPVTAMEYSSPLQWRSRGKVIIAETEAISLWDVNSLNPQPLLSVASSGKRISALHVNNTDAELGGGVRQRVSSSEAEGNDGVFCTQESINVFDLRLPSGVGLRISKPGSTGHSIFSRGDSIYVGCSETRLGMKGGSRSRIQQFSLRKGKLVATYPLPETNAHFHHSSITQVWGNSNLVMGICGMGLFVFDAFKVEGMQSLIVDRVNTIQVRETVGPDDLYYPSFDYLGSRVLVISRDRPAIWRYL